MGSNRNGISKVWWVAETWLHLAMCKSPQDVEMCVKLHMDHQKKDTAEYAADPKSSEDS